MVNHGYNSSLLWITCLMLSLAIFLHVIGLWVLLKTKESSSSNERLFLTNLSVAEILLSISSVALNINEYYICTDLIEDGPCNISRRVVWYFVSAYLLSQLLLLLDRFIGTKWPLKYIDYFPKRRALSLVIISWIFAVILSLPRIHSSLVVYSPEYSPVAGLVMSLSLTVVAISVYGWIAHKVRKQRRIFKTNFNKASSKLVIVPALIISSFGILDVIPNLIISVWIQIHLEAARKFANYLYLCMTINLIIDSIVYLFWSLHLKAAMKRKLFARKPNKNGRKGRDDEDTKQ